MNGKQVGLSLNIALLLLVARAWASAPRIVAARVVAPFDSTGVERRDGETFVLHRVDRGQTLYSILKRYGATFADYKAANPGAPNEVNSNQLLRVPYNRSRAVAAAAEKSASESPVTVSRPENQPVETASADSRPSMAMRQPAATPPPSQPATLPARHASSPSTRPSSVPTARIPESAHEVQPGETLYSIARRYNLPVADLKRWNGLPDAGTVHTGQVLVLNGEIAPKKPTKSAADIAREQLKIPETKPIAKATPPPASRSEPPKPEPVKPEETEARREPEPDAEPESRPARPAVANPSASAKYRRETGLAEVIDVDDKSGRYLGLHRSAAAGSMVTVRNEANGQVVSVKIIGKLPDTGLNDRVIIKLSPGAFSRLSPVDRRFRAEVSYVMQ